MTNGPLFLPRDLECWRQLVACARQASSDLRFYKPLQRAARAAVKAVFPDQSPEKRKPFYELVRLGGLWPNMNMSLRAGHAAKLQALAHECSVILGDEEPSDPDGVAAQPPRWTQRADVGG